MPTRFDSVEWTAWDYQRQYFGTNDDISIRWTTTGLVFAPRIESTEIQFGEADFITDVRFVSNTTGADVQWDASRYQFHFADAALLGIGGANDAAADVTIRWTTTGILQVAVAAEDSVWAFGEADAVMDVRFVADTTGQNMTWDPDASGGTLLFAADTTSAAMPRLQIVQDAAPGGGTQSGGELFLCNNTTGQLYIAAYRNATVISGVELGTVVP